MNPLMFRLFRDETSPSLPTAAEAAAVPGELSRRGSGALGSLGGGELSPPPGDRRAPCPDGRSRSSASAELSPFPSWKAPHERLGPTDHHRGLRGWIR